MQTNLGNELKKRFRISILETFFQNLKSSRFLNKMLGIQKLVAIKKNIKLRSLICELLKYKKKTLSF